MGVHILQRGDSARAPWLAYKLSLGLFHHPAGAICSYSGSQPAGGTPQIEVNPTMTGIATLDFYSCDRTLFPRIVDLSIFPTILVYFRFLQFAKP